MLVNLNQVSGFKLIPEGNQMLIIKDAKVVPSGAPQQIQIKFADIEGNTMLKTYKFDHSGAMYYFGTLLSALGIGDGETFDTNDASKLIGRQVSVEVKHTEYNGNTYADPVSFASVEEPSETIAAIDEDIAYPEIPTTTDTSDIEIDGL